MSENGVSNVPGPKVSEALPPITRTDGPRKRSCATFICCSAEHAPMTYSLFIDSVVDRVIISELSVMSTVEILSTSSLFEGDL